MDVVNEKLTKINTYCNYISSLTQNKNENTINEELQEINENLESIINIPQFTVFFKHALPIILDYLSNGLKIFILEHSGHQIRKSLLELLSRLPFSETRHYLGLIYPVMYNILEQDNEDNAAIALRILTETHKKSHPQKPTEETRKFLDLLKKILQTFFGNAEKIFEPRPQLCTTNLQTMNIEVILNEIYTSTPIKTEMQSGADGSTFTILPRGLYSIKLLSEIPLSIIFLYQIYKPFIDQDILEILPLGMRVISLQADLLRQQAIAKANSTGTQTKLNTNTEIYVEFLQLQVKFLSMISFMVRGFEDKVHSHIEPDKMPVALLNLLKNCPHKVPMIRKDILYSTRYIIGTRYRAYFAPYIEQFFDETVLIGNGWTTRETLRSLGYSVIYDLLHHIRDQLPLKSLNIAINLYSKNLYDESLSMTNHIMSVRLLQNLTDSFQKLAEKENCIVQLREILLKIFEVFANKIRAISKFYIPAIRKRLANSSSSSSSSSALPLALPQPSSSSQTNSQSSNLSSVTSTPIKIKTESTATEIPTTPGGTTSTNNGTACSGSTADPSYNDNSERISKEDLKLKFGFPEPQSSIFSVQECRLLAKTLVNGLKLFSVKLKEFTEKYETNNPPVSTVQNTANGQQTQQVLNISIKTGFCRPRDIAILIRLFRNGLKLFDLYNLAALKTPPTTTTAVSTGSSESGSNRSFGQQTAGGAAASASASAPAPPPPPVSHSRTKEEKEVMEYFAHIFTSLSPQTFRVVMSETIEYFVECINENYNVQSVANSFLAALHTSPIFANVLVEFLLTRMEVMGNNTDLSNLYLKLFKLVFGSVSLFPSENEIMLKPHLHKIVNSSMQMALNAKEPFNYFLLLRALFRSIGGGSHDLLYQEFLPMLPSLLQGLNSLQSGIHRQNMKDLFVELCLTIPVRLSSLLPYLPWLMDPLVSALNGTQNLIAQGLRTLELCVDNLQPDFLYEHIQPIRTELMQALWRTLRHPAESVAQVSFRILGKLGGSNHKLMIEPQKLDYIDFRDSSNETGGYCGSGSILTDISANIGTGTQSIGLGLPSNHGAYSFVAIHFGDIQQPVSLPIDRVIETAYRGLRLSTTDSYYRHQCWEVIKGFFVAHIQHITKQDDRVAMHKLFAHKSFTNEFVGTTNSSATSGGGGSSMSGSSAIPITLSSSALGTFYKFHDEKLRRVHELAITGMITAAAIKELYNTVIIFMIPLVRHYTLVAISQQTGPIHCQSSGSNLSQGSTGSVTRYGGPSKLSGMDPLVLIDAVAGLLGQEEKELSKPCVLILKVIRETTISVMGSLERACQLPLYEYILERVCALCYERAWFSKHGGCIAVCYLFQNMTLRWLFRHQFVLLKAMFFVMNDLSGDLSSGVMEMAKDNLETMIKMCATPIESSPTDDQSLSDLEECQRKSMNEVTEEFLRQLTSPNTTVREHAMHLLQILATTTGKTVTEVMEPHKELLADMVPPKKHKLLQQAVNVQIGLLDGNTFCITLEPRLFTIDITIAEHLNFFNDVYSICDSDDAQLQKYSCYKTVESLVPLRKSALRALAACHYLPTMRSKIFVVLYKALNSSNTDLQECAYQCMDRYKVLKDVNSDLIRTSVRSFLVNINDYRTLNQHTIQRLKYLARLFTYIFNDRFCDQMLQHLIRITDTCANYLRKHRERELKFKAAIAAASANNNSDPQVALDAAAAQHHPALSAPDISEHLRLCAAIINLFNEISASSKSYIEHLLNFLHKTENNLDTYASMKFYEPIRNFFKRYPKESIELLEKRMNEECVFRFYQYLLSGEDGSIFREIIQNNPEMLISTLKNSIKESLKQQPQQTEDLNGDSLAASKLSSYSRYQTIRIISILLKYEPNWLSTTNPELISLLRTIWLSDSFHLEHQNSFRLDYKQWSEPKLLVKCLLSYFVANQDEEIELIFQLLRAFNGKYHCDFEFLRNFLQNSVMLTYSFEWKRNVFFKFVEIFQKIVQMIKERDTGTKAGEKTNAGGATSSSSSDFFKLWPQELISKVLQYLIIPAFSNAFETGNCEALVGQIDVDGSKSSGFCSDVSDATEDLMTVFICRVICADEVLTISHLEVSDCVHIYVLQLACILVENAWTYISVSNKRQDTKVRRLMSYAWPCLLTRNDTDPSTKYYCHLLLAHVISKFAIHKKIVRQVFHSLLKANSIEAKAIVRCALEILIPSLIPTSANRNEDGNKMLTHWTKKLIIEEGHSPAQLIHMLQLIVRNYRLYFMNRHIFLSHMVSQIQRLGFTQTSTVEHRKIALDMVEVIIRWEHQRVALANQMQSDSTSLPMVSGGIGSASGSSGGGGGSTPGPNSTPNQSNEISMEVDGAESDSRSLGGGTKSNFINDPATNASVLAPIEKEYQDAIIAFLIRFICIIHDLNNNGNAGSLATVQHNPLIGGAGISAEYLCRRAISLLKNALQLDIWPNSEFKVLFLERILSSAKDSQPNYLSICMALELLTIFLQTMKPEAVLHIFISLQKAIAICCTCTNSRVVRTVNNLLTKLMALFPPSCASTTISPKSGAPIKVVNQDQLEPLEQLYTEIHSIILNGFGAYDKATTAAAAAAATATGTPPGAVVGPGGGAATIGNRLGPGGMTAAAAAHLINSTTSTLSQLFGTLMILKAACVNHPSYIDRLLTPFMHMLQKLVKEHLHSVIQNGPGGGGSANSQNQNQQQPQNFNATLCIEIIILSLELVKNRLGAMSQEMRRSFITNVFIGLIDKSPEVKIMKTILKIFEEWIKQPMSTTQHGSRASSGTMHHSIAPVLREKAQLLIRIAHNIEKRFGDNQELNAVFLELIHYIYSDDTLKSSDLCSKLEFAFMAGLRCVQAPIRNKFFHNLDSNVRKRLYDRLMYIMCSQNWETIGPHFWIKQCIELVLAVTDHNLPLTTLNPQALIPLPTSLVSVTGTDHSGCDKWNSYNFGDSGLSSSINPTDMLMDFDFIGSNFGDVVMADISDTKPNTSTNGANLDHSAHNATTEANTFLSDFFGSCIGSSPSVVDVSGGGSGSGSATTTATTSANPKSLLQVLSIVCNFLQHLSQASNHTFISAVAQLCHLDNSLAQHVWIHLFPRIYSVLPERQQRMISLQVAQFLLSGSHSPQRDAPLSAIGTFFEAVVQCEPPITLHPEALKYLSRNHNVWHRSALLLETTLDRIQSIPNCQSLYLSGLVSLLGPGAAPSGAFALPTTKTSTRGSSVAASTPAGTTPGGDAAVVSTAATGPLPTSILEIFPAELQLNNGPTYADLCSSALCNVYEFLKEEDYWAGIWHRRAKYPETLIAISYEQQGNFERAKSSYELVMGKAREDFSQKPAPYSQNDEITLWERRWIRCSKELNQWDFLLEYGNTPDGMNPLLVLESAWRIPDWDQMNHAIFAVESNLPKDVAWKVALYKGYNAICNSANRDLDIVERMVELASNFLIKEWRRLPHLVSAVHIDILHAAHQVIELQEAARLHQGLFNPAGQSHSPGSFCANNNSIERVGVDLRAVIKTWKNRLPVLSDDLSHWSDIFTWRQHHYQTIVSRFESEANRSTSSGSSSAASGTSSSVNSQAASQNALLGAHASAQSLIHYAKIARKHFLPNVSLESLNRIHTIPRVPIIDCFQKIRQQLKCYLLLHHIQPNGDELQEGLSVIESTHLKYFQREMISEFYAMKGYFQMKLGQMDEAKLSFSTAAQIQDTLVKAWALWGEYHDQLFTDESVPFAQRDMEHGVQAIISYLHACRHQNEAKSRKYLSKVLWLLSYDDDSHTLAQAAERYNTGVPTVNWLPWVPQLLQCLIRTEGNLMMGIVLQVSKLYPQAVYFPIRTIFLTQKMEQRDMKYKTMMMSNAAGAISGPGGQIAGSEQMVLATAGMMRCSRIMHQMRDINPTILTVLEGIVDQLTWFRENWYEEVLRQLRQVLVKCYTVAFENRANVSDTPIPQHTFNFFRKLVANFGIGIDNASAAAAAAAASAGGGGGQQRQSQQQQHQQQQSQSDQQQSAGSQRNIRNINTTASESLAKRAQATAQDPIFQKLKVQFTNDFDFSVPGSKKLHNLIGKLKKWIKILEAKTKLFPKSWLLEEKCRYLSNFSQHTVDVSLPGEYLLPKLGHISIARFMPRVEIVTKHNTAARRLYIRGHNGKIYPYLVLNDSPLSETRREERLLQLLRLLNLYLTKHKETARRLLYFTVPRVVPITPQMRFVEDNPSSLSLVEIYKQHVIRRGSDPDAPIAKYYDRLLSVQTKGSQVSLPTLRDIVSDIQSSMAPRTLLREWALLTYSGATDFWHFRKLFTQQLALAGISEFALYLTRLNPDMMYVHRDSGLMNIAYYRFDLNEESGELASTQPVPFRLAYSMANLITETGILGPLTATMISSASCLVHPNYKVRSILFAILRDEIISWYKRQKTNEKMVFLTAAAIQAAQAAQAASASGDETKNSDSGGQLSQQQQQQQQLGRNSQQANAFSAAISASQQEIPEMNREELVNLVTKAVNAIMSRLQSLATFEGSDSKVATLIADATNQDNLCQMDPAWHPWL